MRKCFEYQKRLHDTLRDKLYIGISENDIAKIIDSFGIKWQGDIISGERSADIEGGATQRKIAPGDALICDIQFFDGEMWSDITRTYFFGEPSPIMSKCYDKIINAIKSTECILKADVKCSEIYDFLQKEIDYKYSFKHHAGHLIGNKPLIKPQFLPDTDGYLEKGMSVTLEPGIYLPGEFGIRVENNYLITKEGYEKLFDYPEDMEYFVIKR